MITSCMQIVNIVNRVWFFGMGNTVTFPVSFSMIAMTAFQLFFRVESGPVLFALSYLISIAVDIAAYIGVLLLYRKRLYNNP